MRNTSSFCEELRLERLKLGAKLRATRAILNISQTELALKVGLTQRSVHRLEQGQVDPKRGTSHRLERFWRRSGISIVDMPDGSFSISTPVTVLCCAEDAQSIEPDSEPFRRSLPAC